MRDPYGGLLLGGRKTVETRSYALLAAHEGVCGLQPHAVPMEIPYCSSVG